MDNQRRFLEEISQRLNMHSLDDWYNVSTAEFKALNGHGFLSHYKGSLISGLMKVYPSTSNRKFM